ncbi:MAG TPA: sulfotransferase [Candidatus Tenderia sp.]|nr:sulfotransferase [Candidatus Tenderia sp.]
MLEQVSERNNDDQPSIPETCLFPLPGLAWQTAHGGSDAASYFAVPPETFFLEHFVRLARDKAALSGLEGLGVDSKDTMKELGIWAARYHEICRKALGKPRWGDKTPSYVAIWPEIEAMFGPGAQYVLVLRHPLDSLVSLVKRGWRFGDRSPDLLVNNAIYIAEGIQKMLAAMDEYAARCHALHYEHLIVSPESELRKVFGFLDSPWEKEVLRYHEKEHGFGTEDPIVCGAKGFIPNFGNWRTLLDKELDKVLPILEPWMNRLGYSLEADFPPVRDTDQGR